jgi:NAD(P)H-hydrate repair Nnr-like enzyme with NAD(P)H-hydrate epimerase domain
MLFGSGLNQEGELQNYHINESDSHVISIDIPSGYLPIAPPGQVAVKADHTLSFQNYVF